MTALFIVFEGLDGSGTSTQSRLLADYLKTSGETRVHLTAEPSSGPIGQMIRTAMSGRLRFNQDEAAFDKQMAYLFAADRNDHLFNDTDGVVKLKQSGDHVISTRYFFSSYAYHCDTDEDFAFVRMLNAEFPDPDAVIYIDIAVDASTERLSERAHLDRYENSEKLTKVRRSYERGLACYSGPLLRVLGHEDPREIHDRIVAFIDSLRN
jgi:dTMP kinase